jgi:hypothetical protein
MPENNLLERLTRMNAKVERGEKLTDAEQKQLKEDMEQMNQACADMVETMVEALKPVAENIAGAAVAMQELQVIQEADSEDNNLPEPIRKARERRSNQRKKEREQAGGAHPWEEDNA